MLVAEGCYLELPQILSPGVFIENTQLQKEITSHLFGNRSTCWIVSSAWKCTEPCLLQLLLLGCSFVVAITKKMFKLMLQIRVLDPCFISAYSHPELRQSSGVCMNDTSWNMSLALARAPSISNSNGSSYNTTAQVHIYPKPLSVSSWSFTEGFRMCLC